MKRRAILLAAPAWLLLPTAGAVLAQSKSGPVVIGWLNTGSRSTGGNLKAFKEGMSSLGWGEGQDYTLIERWVEGKMDRLEALAQEIAAAKPALIVAATSSAVAAAARAAPATPVVCANGDLFSSGLIKTLARPGGMVTGVSNIGSELVGKLAELLLDISPRIRKLGILVDTTAITRNAALRIVKQSVERLRLEAHFAELTRVTDIEPALSRLAKLGVQALLQMPSAWFASQADSFVKHAQAHRLPLVSNNPIVVERGALMGYGANPPETYRRAASYVDKILKGAKPGDLPVEQPTRFELVLNLKAAKALGFTFNKTLLARADRVIE